MVKAMNDDNTLTEEERRSLLVLSPTYDFYPEDADTIRKALACIDALTAENCGLKEADRAAAKCIRELSDLRDALTAENERLREKLGLTERTLLTSIRAADRESDAAEARLVELTAENARLRAEVDHWAAEASAFDGQRMAAQARLATAVGEIDRLQAELNAAKSTIERWREGRKAEKIESFGSGGLNGAQFAALASAQPAAPQCSNTEAFLSGENTGCDGVNCPVHTHGQPAAPKGDKS